MLRPDFRIASTTAKFDCSVLRDAIASWPQVSHLDQSKYLRRDRESIPRMCEPSLGVRRRRRGRVGVSGQRELSILVSCKHLCARYINHDGVGAKFNTRVPKMTQVAKPSLSIRYDKIGPHVL